MRNLLRTVPEFEKLFAALREGRVPVVVSGASGAFKAVLSAGLFAEGKFSGALLVIVPGPDQINAWQTDLESLFADREVLVFDPAEALPFEVVAASREPTAGRLRVLARLREPGSLPPVVVAAAEALLPKLIPASIWEQAALFFKIEGEYDLSALLALLGRAGYERVELVAAPGQFALRGGILDIYPFQGTPVRLEFWDNEVTSIKELDPETQRSCSTLTQVIIWPAREFIYDPNRSRAAVERINTAYKTGWEKLRRSRSAQTRLSQRLNRFTEMAAEGTGFSLHLLQPYFYPEQVSLLDYLPPGSLVVLDEPGRLLEQWHSRTALLESEYRHLLQEGQTFTLWQDYYYAGESLFRELAALTVVAFSRLLARTTFFEPREIIKFAVKEMQPFLGRPDLLVPEVREWLKRRTTVLLLTQTEARLQQLERDFRDHGLGGASASTWPQFLEAGRLNMAVGNLSQGFEVPGRLSVVTGEELYGRKKVRHRTGVKRAVEAPGTLPELILGDYVVHQHHGIGRYAGIKEMAVEGRTRDYLEIIYARGDRLYVPIDQMGLIQRYVGPEGHAPRLSRLGGRWWARLKHRVKRKVQELAQDLLALYAKRMASHGHAFSCDTVWQREFEDAFSYEETPDQMRAIAEVKADMEKPRPMDRLVCGDVGFGKTEVALRAAFKAVQDNKQVAVLAPTTVLAQQHYHTFKERFAPYPVQVEMLSRFCSRACQKMTVRALAQGMIDVVIGTHRLLSDDVKFRDLGLLIIDEEQRFGVSHKERIKALKTNVDVLTLTATPIPRTLQMSLSGVRDLSLIETPPEDRLSVQTYVLEYSPFVVREAILREIQRGGQVFYVHNRIQTIEKCAVFLRGLVPEASFRVAHGQMKDDELEGVMLDFLNNRIDCLVCTTIIENGLDLPNVNTLIVERADQFGLAQLYQLRGRVGRSNLLAYAYFTFARDKVLTEQAEKRLYALQEFTEFGSGFKLALRDLGIRGAGSLLGPEQHGHMGAVGFDLYNQLLEEAVRKLKGEKVPEHKAQVPVWELHAESYLPDSYVGDARQKVEIYRRLVLANDLKEAEDLEAEVRDRFGPLPDPALQLFTLVRLQIRARELQISRVQHTDHTLVVRFDDGVVPEGAELTRWSAVFARRVSFSAVGGLEVRVETRGLEPHRLIGMLSQVLLPQH